MGGIKTLSMSELESLLKEHTKTAKALAKEIIARKSVERKNKTS